MNFYKKIKENSILVMGVINLTPDSFYDGNKYNNLDIIRNRVQNMISEGVDIIDFGAISSRPGAEDINEREEISRLSPIFTNIMAEFPNTIISIDTYRSNIANKAIINGANIINDIYSGNYDSNIINVVKDHNIPYVIMHMQGEPKNMQKNINYKNFEYEILSFFEKKIQYINSIGHTKLILDPGFGFGKTLQQNYQLVSLIPKIKKFGFPVLIGVSRKSMISRLLNTSTQESLNGTSILNSICINHGANIIRVHDIKEAKEVVKIIYAVRKNSLNK